MLLTPKITSILFYSKQKMAPSKEEEGYVDRLDGWCSSRGEVGTKQCLGRERSSTLALRVS